MGTGSLYQQGRLHLCYIGAHIFRTVGIRSKADGNIPAPENIQHGPVHAPFLKPIVQRKAAALFGVHATGVQLIRQLPVDGGKIPGGIVMEALDGIRMGNPRFP